MFGREVREIAQINRNRTIPVIIVRKAECLQDYLVRVFKVLLFKSGNMPTYIVKTAPVAWIVAILLQNERVEEPRFKLCVPAGHFLCERPPAESISDSSFHLRD